MSEKAGEFITFAAPEIGEEEIAEVVDTLRSGWITTGPKARLFEEQFSEYLGGGVESIAVNSATAGLHLALALEQCPKLGNVRAVPKPAQTLRRGCTHAVVLVFQIPFKNRPARLTCDLTKRPDCGTQGTEHAVPRKQRGSDLPAGGTGESGMLERQKHAHVPRTRVECADEGDEEHEPER